MDSKRKVIILGDSFTFGQGCSDRDYYYDHELKQFVGEEEPIMKCIPSNNCWATLLQNEYPNLEVVNLSEPGNSNAAMFRNLTDFIANNGIAEDDIILLNGTNPDRIEVAIPCQEKPKSWVLGWDHHSRLLRSEGYNQAKEMYIKYLYNDQIGFNYLLMTLLGSYGYAMTYKTKFVWSFPHAIRRPHAKHCAPSNLIPYMIQDITRFDFSGKRDDVFNFSCRSTDFHVNDLGHSIFYEKQIKPLIEKFLNT
jgi:hypothetical protein